MPDVAAASPSKARLRERVAHQREVIRDLRRDLRATRETLGTASADLATRTAERDRERTRVAALRAQIASRPTALYTAIETVRREVAYSEQVFRWRSVSYSREQLVAQAAMTHVVGHVSAPAYGYMNVFLGSVPKPTANGVLASGAGICGHAALTFAAIVKAFKLPVRSVQFYYGEGDNHIAAEVFYNGAWHYYDPTFGAYYIDGLNVLSIEQARAHPDPGSLLLHDRTLLWYTVASRAGATSLTDFGIETDPDTRVEIDQQPFGTQ